MIVIVDYGVSNLLSVENAFRKLGMKAVTADNPEVIRKADRLILPGVGSFGNCLAGIKQRSLFEAVTEFIASGKPFLGICVGMQIMFEKSFEFGVHEGIGFFKGEIKSLSPYAESKKLKIPHIGWNNIDICRNHSIFTGISASAYFYFVHSFYAADDYGNVAATCNYGTIFAAVVIRENVVGTQFHPEKSQRNGLLFLENFGKWKC